MTEGSAWMMTPIWVWCGLHWLQNATKGQRSCFVQICFEVWSQVWGCCWDCHGRMKWINGLHPCSKYHTLMSKFSMPPCWVVKMILKELRLMMGTSERAHSGPNGMVPKALILRLMLIRRAQIFLLADTLFLANNLINSPICEDRLICEIVLFLHVK